MKQRFTVILPLGILSAAADDYYGYGSSIYCDWTSDARLEWFCDHAEHHSKYAYLYASPTGSWDDAVMIDSIGANYDYCFGS